MDTIPNDRIHFPVTDIHCHDLTMRRRQVNGIASAETRVAGGKYYVMLRLLKPAKMDESNVDIEDLNVTEFKADWGKKKPKAEKGKPAPLPCAYQMQVKKQDGKEPDQHKTYTLRLRESKDHPESPLPRFDPWLSAAEFSFDVDLKPERDLPPPHICPPPALDEPDMNYLAKDYASFRQLVLDRLALIMPEWRERHVPDLGITLVELLAYVGDYLSAYQDAVATEAYLNTARQRISVRRHARLVDYRLHEGCNARALLCLTVEQDLPALDPANVYFVTDHALTFPLPGAISRESDLREAVARERYEIFELVTPDGPSAPGEPEQPPPQEAPAGEEPPSPEPSREPGPAELAKAQEPAEPVKQAAPAEPARPEQQAEPARPEPPAEPPQLQFYSAHNRICFYTWGQRECCLPKGATRAALLDGPPLPEDEPQPEPEPPKPEEQRGKPAKKPVQPEEPPSPAEQEEAIRQRLDERRVLRLKAGDWLIVEEVLDPATGLAQDADPQHRQGVRLTRVTRAYDLLNRQAVLEIEWQRADALTFPLCLSAISDDCDYHDDISLARGNVVLVDHGETTAEKLEPVERPDPQRTCDECGEATFPRPKHYRPHLKRYPVVFRDEPRLDVPVRSLLHERDPRAALPLVTLQGYDPYSGQRDTWQPQYDLLDSGADERNFVVEVDDRRVAHLRFGDDELGERPAGGTQFEAGYRVGDPLAGNVGAEAICRLIVRKGLIAGISAVRNPLPATGGQAPETVANVKLRAPHAFRQRMERAITAEDYARLAEKLVPGLQKAYARLDASTTQAGRYTVTLWFDPLSVMEWTEEQIIAQIQDRLYPYRRIGHDIVATPGKPVTLQVDIAVKVKPQAVAERVKEAVEAALGNHGFFDPDKLTFDQGISLSQVVSVTQRVAGVERVKELVITKDGDPNSAEKWPDAAGAGDDWMKFAPGEIPSLGPLNVT